MKNVNRRSWRAIIKASFLFMFLTQVAFIFPNSIAFGELDNISSEIVVTTQTVDSVSFSWDEDVTINTSRIWFVKTENGYTSAEISTCNNSICFSNLPSGTYSFHFIRIYDSGEIEAIVIDDLIMG